VRRVNLTHSQHNLKQPDVGGTLRAGHVVGCAREKTVSDLRLCGGVGFWQCAIGRFSGCGRFGRPVALHRVCKRCVGHPAVMRRGDYSATGSSSTVGGVASSSWPHWTQLVGVGWSKWPCPQFVQVTMRVVLTSVRWCVRTWLGCCVCPCCSVCMLHEGCSDRTMRRYMAVPTGQYGHTH
jgi:hypothetical protein